MKIICKVWGHSEVQDMQHPVSWCCRCGETMSEYGWPNDKLSPSFEIGRPFLWVKNELRLRAERLARRVKNAYMTRKHGENWDIPF